MAENEIEKPQEQEPNDAFSAYSEMFPKENFIALGKQVVFDLMDVFEEVKACYHNSAIGRSGPYYIRNRSEDRPKTMIVHKDGTETESPLEMESLVALWEIIGSGQFDIEPTPESIESLINEFKHSENLKKAEIDAITTDGFQIEIEGMYVNIDMPGRIELIDNEINLIYTTLEEKVKKICETLNMTYRVEDQSRLDEEANFKLAAWLITFQKISEEEL